MDTEPFVRMLVAALLATPIGLDRELRGKAAGLRTHVVVGTAAAALGYVSVLSAPLSATGADGTRIAAQVVSGIGFMGAGVIFAAGGRVHGLTTAAALFSVAAVGLCVGLGQVPLAVALVVVTFLFLWPIDRVTQRLIGSWIREDHVVHVLAGDAAVLTDIQRVLTREGTPARDISLDGFGGAIAVRLTFRARRAHARDVLTHLAALDGVSFLSDEAFAPTD